MISMKTEAERLKEAEEEYQSQLQSTIDAEEEHRRKLEQLFEISGNEALSTDTRREALYELVGMYPQIFAKYKTEYEWLQNLKQIKQEIAILDGKNSVTNPKNQLADVNSQILQHQRNIAKWEKDKENTKSPYARAQYEKYIKEAQTQIQMLSGKKATLTKQVEKDNVNAWLATATGFGNATLDAELKVREDLVARLEMNGGKKVLCLVYPSGAAGE